MVDATLVKEPGRTGSLWRLHYSVQLPSLVCDHFRITPFAGAGTGESFTQFPVRRGDLVLGDRGYSSARGIAHVAAAGGQPGRGPGQHRFAGLRRRGRGAVRPARGGVVAGPGGHGAGVARVDRGRCAGPRPGVRGAQVRHRVRLAQKKLRGKASKLGKELRPETLEYAKYVVVFTTFPAADFTPAAVLDWYRVRWQVELVFKRFKSITRLGHLGRVHWTERGRVGNGTLRRSRSR